MNVSSLPQKNAVHTIERIIYLFLIMILLSSLVLVISIYVVPHLTGSQSQTSFSSDWSGYSVASDLNDPQPQVTSINGSWIVPTVNVSISDSFCAAWIGIGGQFDETLIQIGTEHDSVNGQASYSAWYELLPSDAVTIDSLSISPGDSIMASISLSDPNMNTWSMALHDITNGQSFQISLVYDSSMLSAEWIVERPTVNNSLAKLANFGQITFSECIATIGSSTGTISSFPSVQFTMYNRQNIELVNVSSLSSDGSVFTVNYLD